MRANDPNLAKMGSIGSKMRTRAKGDDEEKGKDDALRKQGSMKVGLREKAKKVPAKKETKYTLLHYRLYKKPQQ